MTVRAPRTASYLSRSAVAPNAQVPTTTRTLTSRRLVLVPQQLWCSSALKIDSLPRRGSRADVSPRATLQHLPPGPLVVGYTGSARSRLALQVAAALARDESRDLVCVYARGPECAPSGLLDGSLSGAEYEQQREAEVRARLQGQLQAVSVRWRMVVDSGHPADVLCAVAVAERACAILLGGGRRGASRVAAALSSLQVARRLLSRTQIPVVVIAGSGW